MKEKIILYLTYLLIISVLIFSLDYSGYLNFTIRRIQGKQTVEGVISQIGERVELKYKDLFRISKVEFPPKELLLIAYKEEKILELWGKSDSDFKQINVYKIRKASGNPGPKLLEGDKQVPEGIYDILGLNPNSRFHLSLKLDYPNSYDKEKATIDGRIKLGGDIFIHGKEVSIGCLAMGDEVAEDLFVLVALVGKENVKVIISPNRNVNKITNHIYPSWVNDLYPRIRFAINNKKAKL
ncbi:L,D-transpeptidase family protein [Leptospira alstonii]|uniref:L,D-transpeptidase family protein n=1 Tax=Leptospira alstonii TaxID=28452 RepID=UPI0007748C5F|nr:L,D-transpeptidase family protein [Leptospira alstonii]